MEEVEHVIDNNINKHLRAVTMDTVLADMSFASVDSLPGRRRSLFRIIYNCYRICAMMSHGKSKHLCMGCQ
jgi:hypothetical protein